MNAGPTAPGLGAPAAAPPAAARRFGRAWLALALALALHVADEALTGFLDVYNPAVHTVRARLPWLPLPTFTFRPWLLGLVVGLLLLLALTPRAFRGSRALATIGLPFAVLMIGNGIAHLGGSVYFGRLLPGVFSAPLVIAAAGYVVFSSFRIWKRPRPA